MSRLLVNLDIPADQAIGNAVRESGDPAPFHDDAAFNLRTAYLNLTHDRGEGPDKGVSYLRVLTNDDWTVDHGVRNDGTRFDDYVALNLRRVIDGALDLGVELAEDQSVRIQEIFHPASVLPPAVDNVRKDHQISVDEVLDGIGNLKFVAEARRDSFD